MSRDTILKDEEGNKYSYDNLKTQGWLEGHYCGLDCAVKTIADKAVDFFREGKHDKAIEYQKLAKEIKELLEPEMRRRAKEHEEQYPAQVSSVRGK